MPAESTHVLPESRIILKPGFRDISIIRVILCCYSGAENVKSGSRLAIINGSIHFIHNSRMGKFH